ncbi:MAG: nucleotide-binding universal stress UspA family protein [Lentimonas sp.]|jgi:nucleotide-binding universal stress UspA family protein
MPINTQSTKPQTLKPMKNILACTDGSLYSPSVYQHAAWAAQKLEASVHLLHMLNPHHESPMTSDYSGSIGFGAKSSLLGELVALEAAKAKIAQKLGQAILDDAEQALKTAGITSILADQKHGKLSDEITHYERDADLVVLGKRGNDADFEKGHLGSNLERVIRSCQHPVLVASREFAPIKNFVLAFDGGPSAQKAVKFVASSALLQGTHCYLLYVGSGNAKIEAALATAAHTLQAAGFEVSIEQRTGEPEKVIGAVVAQDHIDLLVMGAYGHSHIRQFIVGSTTSAMIRSVKLPVLLFR